MTHDLDRIVLNTSMLPCNNETVDVFQSAFLISFALDREDDQKRDGSIRVITSTMVRVSQLHLVNWHPWVRPKYVFVYVSKSKTSPLTLPPLRFVPSLLSHFDKFTLPNRLYKRAIYPHISRDL